MVENSLGAVVEAHFDPVALRNCGSHNAAKMHWHLLKTTHEPACAGGSNGSVAQPVLHCTRKTANKIGSCDDLADSRRTNIGWRVKQLGDFGAKSAMNCARDQTAQPT